MKDDKKRKNRPEESAAEAGPSSTTQHAKKKEDAADIARRRAAHFANFAPEELDQTGNIHVGGTNARQLGMWSSAIELANNREKAQQEREERLRSGGQQEQGDDEDKVTIEWQGRDIRHGPIVTLTPIPSLFSACLRLLVDYIDCVDSLEGVPDSIRGRLAAEVCLKRKMSMEVANLFVSGAPAEVSLPDCSLLDASDMSLLLTECLTPRLTSLCLGSCGRGFGDEQADLFSAQAFDRLSSLSFSGAYRLNDHALLKVVTSCPNLESLVLSQCSRITGDFIAQLPPKLKTLDLTDCRGINLEVLVNMLPQMNKIQSLSLDGILTVDDDVMEAVAKLQTLKHLGISYSQVSDMGMEVISKGCPGLVSLKMDECLNVTDEGMVMKGLRDLSIRRCTKLGDASISILCANGGLVSVNASGVIHLGDLAMLSLAERCKESLLSLDVSFCREISEDALGLVADSCSRLKEMRVFGCSQVGKKLINGHSNENLSIVGA